MLSNGSNYVQYPTKDSVIKIVGTCCLEVGPIMEYEAKVKHNIQLTHQNYLKIEQENRGLHFQVENLENRLKDQNYQYACLKHELEQLNRQNFDLIDKLSEFPEPQSDQQFQTNKSSTTNVLQKIESSKEGTCHFLDTKKLPEIFCACGLQWKSNQSLKDHIRYHTTKAKFACPLCEVKKNGLNLLKYHMKSKHVVTEFTPLKGCRTCGKVFSTLKELQEHKRREHGWKKTWNRNK